MALGRPQFDPFVSQPFRMEELSATLTAQNIAGLTLADGQEILGNSQQVFNSDSSGSTTFLDVGPEDIEGEQVQDEINGDTAISSVSGKAGTYQLTQAQMDAQEERRRKQEEDDEADRNRTAVMERIESQKFWIGNMEMSRAQMDSAIDFLSDPNNRDAAAKAYARQNGTSVQQGKNEIDSYTQYLIAKRAIADGNATPEQQSFVSGFEADPNFQDKLSRMRVATQTVGAEVQADQGAQLAMGNARTVLSNATSGNNAQNNAVITNIQDSNLQGAALEANGYSAGDAEVLAAWGSGTSDTLSFADGTREGPVISSAYNSSAAGDERQLAQVQAPAASGQTSTIELGMG
ncbi:MAG: hypothetical protein AB7E85_08655 [Pseudobdellovibrionaceae bacterium]